MARCLAAIWLWSTATVGLFIIDSSLDRCKHRPVADSTDLVTDLYCHWFHICTAHLTLGGAQMSGYGQFCPVAKAMELLDERWTMLVVRELLAGSGHFNDLRRGVPKMSPALLSKRLKSLTRAGVVESLGAWGVRWICELGDD